MTIIERISERFSVPDALAYLGIPERHRRFRCPAHEDSNPSASYKADRWRCWTCGAFGRSVNLVMHAKGITLNAAISLLAEMLHLEDQDYVPKPPVTATDYWRAIDQAINAGVSWDALYREAIKHIDQDRPWAERTRRIERITADHKRLQVEFTNNQRSSALLEAYVAAVDAGFEGSPQDFLKSRS